ALASALLALPLRLKRLLPFGHSCPVTLWVDPHLLAGSGLRLLQFFEHSKVSTMRPEENIARQVLEGNKGSLIIRGNTRIRSGSPRLVDEAESGVHIPASHNHHIAKLAAHGRPHRPGGAAAGVAGSLMCDQHYAPQPHLIAIVQHTIHLHRRIKIFGVVEVLGAATL